VDVFEGCSFNDRHFIVIVEEEGVPGKENSEGAGNDGEFNSEKFLENNDFTIMEALQSPPLTRRLPEPPPTHTNAGMAALPYLQFQVSKAGTNIATHTPNRCSCKRHQRLSHATTTLTNNSTSSPRCSLGCSTNGKCRARPSEEDSCSGFGARPPSHGRQ
jgi:hypothetical protein